MLFSQHANKEIDVKGRKLTPTGELESWPDGTKPYIKGTASQIGPGVTCDVCGEKFTCNTKVSTQIIKIMFAYYLTSNYIMFLKMFYLSIHNY